MKNKIIILAALLTAFTIQAQEVIVTNPILNNPLTVSNVVSAVPKGLTTVATDGYSVFKNFSPTNPLSIGVFGLQNGAGKYGIGLEANTVRTDSGISAGFAVAGIQVEKDGKTKWGFYDATINLSASGVWNLPVLNLPLITRVFSGPFVSLDGGVLIGAQSGACGDLAFDLSKNMNLDFGGGVVNCAGAAATGLKPAMPMAHVNITLTSWKFWK